MLNRSLNMTDRKYYAARRIESRCDYTPRNVAAMRYLIIEGRRSRRATVLRLSVLWNRTNIPSSANARPLTRAPTLLLSSRSVARAPPQAACYLQPPIRNLCAMMKPPPITATFYHFYHRHHNHHHRHCHLRHCHHYRRYHNRIFRW